MATIKIRRALLSVSNKDGLAGFASALQRHGVELVSTGGTARLLRLSGIQVRAVSELTGHPEILDGRVKTLHPKIHGALLANRKLDSHLEELRAHDILPIDLVVCNLYPFEQTIAKPDCTVETAIENIDIGGPCMVRAAAKNHHSVAVVVNAQDYGAIVAELDENDGGLSDETRRDLARKAFHHTAHYDSIICDFLDQNANLLPEKIHVRLERTASLRYGENPHQQAALYRDDSDVGVGLLDGTQFQGKKLSYNNYIDMAGALECVRVFSEPTAVVVKHTNPCGVATSYEGLLDAYRVARSTDETSSFGGIVGFNRIVDEDVAKALTESFLEAVVAPGYTEKALAAFKRKKRLRIMEVPFENGELSHVGQTWTKLRGGVLVQQRDKLISDPADWKIVTKRQPTADELRALIFGWTVCRFVKSNAIVYAAKNRTLGIGAGQMSRVDAAKIAVRKANEAGLSLEGSVVASDAFFPFRDSIDALAAAGAACVVQPGGSIRDAEVIEAADELGIAMVFTGVRHFRH